ncbi:hypothetical protein D1007_46137 [Hordeum vulgare]|nr:hypothetical protein D1007_46137 [Hordeum vulgare]
MAVAVNYWAGETKWLKHYSSAQHILIVGDGDFSFSLALATAFGSGANLVATSLDSYAEIWFDRIVFNFPHAGFNGPEDKVDVIKSHQELVRSFFATARHMIWRHGEIHVTHKTKHPFSIWGIEQLAFESSLVMVEQAAFQIQDYPGYNHKRGSSWRCDQDFAIGDCSTFKFRLF